MSELLSCTELTKKFKQHNMTDLLIFNKINVQIATNQIISIVGSSGSGKTSLLQVLAGLDEPSSGTVYFAGVNIHVLTETAMCKLRNQQLGFVYQFHHLLPEFTAFDNVLMPMMIAGAVTATAKQYVYYLLSRLGLADRALHFPAQLSGGERQRVAIARALIHKPQLVFADEPTGNVDQATAKDIFTILLELQHEFGMSIILVTHDMQLAERADIVYCLQDCALQLHSSRICST